MQTPPFHLAITVDELVEAEGFYAGILGAQPVARGETWVVFDFFGHKLTINRALDTTTVPSDDIALRHFGVILGEAVFHEVNERLVREQAHIVSSARLDHDGTPRAQWVLFVRDPSGNGLEFNAFPDGSWQKQLA